jgi:hypothetical protein
MDINLSPLISGLRQVFNSASHTTDTGGVPFASVLPTNQTIGRALSLFISDFSVPPSLGAP